ncbi:MAG: xanthine dehydrogenase small subunit [Kineosporiaceae bacterium]
MPAAASWSFAVNGATVDGAGLTPDRALLEVLRDRGLVGTKEGCGDGDCGACTVAVLGRRGDGSPAWLATNSCLVPVSAVAGGEVLTVEGVARDGDVHPAQRAMVDHGGSQCGYCTPGFVMSLVAGYYDPRDGDARDGQPRDSAARDGDGGLGDDVVEGNLCRCTGYLPIRRAARCLPRPAAGDPLVPTEPAPPPVVGRSPEGLWYRPPTLDQALAALAAHPDATVVAGATDLGLEMSHRTRRFPVLVHVDEVDELRRLEVTADHVDIGAAVPLSHLEQRLPGVLPALDDMLPWFAARQIRNRATVGGNLATASPIGDLAPVLLALDALVTVAGPGGTRIVPVDGFVTGYRRTVLGPGELVVSVRVPRGASAPGLRRVSRAAKVAKRATDDISVVAAAFTLDLDPDGVVHHARLAYGGVAATPVRARGVEQWLVGRRLDESTIEEARRRLGEEFAPIDDLRASAGYRRALAGNLFARFAFGEREAAVPR